MPNNHPASLTDNAFRIGCGYALGQLESNRCPECGRPFDPSDPLTTSAGRPLRHWQRQLLRPPGWPLIALEMLGIANRGEAERFLYYDGPTRLSVPVNVTMEDAGHRLRFSVTPDQSFENNPHHPEEYPKHPSQQNSSGSGWC